jgi:hypothetical protein
MKNSNYKIVELSENKKKKPFKFYIPLYNGEFQTEKFDDATPFKDELPEGFKPILTKKECFSKKKAKKAIRLHNKLLKRESCDTVTKVISY